MEMPLSTVIIDANWCIENIELAAEYFNEKQSENSNLEIGLNILRKYKKELDELYWQIRGLIKQFNNYYSEMIMTKKDLENLQDEEDKGLSENLFIEQKDQLIKENQLRNKLIQIFQNLIESHDNIRNKIPTISWKEEIYKLNTSAQKLYDEGEYNQAIERWNSILNIDPKNQTALDGIDNTKNKIISHRVKNFCPSCGLPNERRLKYCTHCGASLLVT